MGVLLDTHALLWWFVGDSRMSASALACLDESPEAYDSLVLLWEIGLKMGGKSYDFELSGRWHEELPGAAGRFDIRQAPLKTGHCRLISDLPLHHKDPFDRMLIAQALVSGWTIIGNDERFDAYGVPRVW